MIRTLPRHTKLMMPTLLSLSELGGRGTTDEIFDCILDMLEIDLESDFVFSNTHRNAASELKYRLAWARTYLKKGGYVQNLAPKLWLLCVSTEEIASFDHLELSRLVRSSDLAKK